jgi:hypothetical protein
VTPGQRALFWLVFLTVVAGCCWGGRLIVGNIAAGPDYVNLHDCLTDDPGADPPYERVACDDAAAKYRALLVVEPTPRDGNPCLDVPGASRLYEISDDGDSKTVCLGTKDADPAKAANTARDGDCLRIGRGVEAERLDCKDPRANVKVLRRLTRVVIGVLEGYVDGPCADVPGTALRYVYQWHSDRSSSGGRTDNLPGEYVDLLFCVARVNEPPPAVPGAAYSCRFITRAGMLAAVRAAGGSEYIAVSGGTSGGRNPCVYSLVRETHRSDTVVLWFKVEDGWPPDKAEEFTVDGQPLAWRTSATGRGGDLYVDRPTGRLEIKILRDDPSKAREMAVAIYRAAARHLP